MQKVLLTLLGIMLLPMTALGQWEFEAAWPPVEELQYSSAHGIAVDPDGKVWIQYFGAIDSVQVPALNNEYRPVRVIYVINADGTEADISPIKFLDFPGGERDTLGGYTTLSGTGEKTWEGRSGRGLATDSNGNILVSQFKTLYRIDYMTGAGMNKAEFADYCALAAPASAETGNVFVAPVCPGPPLRVLDEAFGFVENGIDATVGFSRSFEVSADANTIYWSGYTNNAVIAYSRPDEFSAYDSVGVVIPGVDSESMERIDATGLLWVSAGSSNDRPNDYEGFETNWEIQTWYAFDLNELAVNTAPVAQASLAWTPATEADTTGRPRGIAFGPDGDVAYIINFSQSAPSVQKLTMVPTAIEPVGPELPAAIALKQNYPNPFNPSTTIQFAVKESGHVMLKVYSTLGRQVATLVDEQVAPGSYEVRFDATGLASGTYLYVLESNGQRLNRTMQVVK